MKRIALLLLTAAIAVIAQKRPVPVRDGGVNESLESIFIPPMPDAPFTLTLNTEWVHAMADGGTITLVNHRRIARQSSGRFYQERWMLVPKNGSMQSGVTHIQIAEPANHLYYTCVMGMNVCRTVPYGGTTSTVYTPDLEPSSTSSDGRQVINEPLGKDVLQHVEVVGTRITRITPVGAIGNDKPIRSTREFWFAPSLGINLVSKIADPRFGSQTFTVTDLELGEPDPALFELPKGFAVQDDRVR